MLIAVLVAIIIILYLIYRNCYEETFMVWAVILGIFSTFLVLALFYYTNRIVSAKTIDEKIKMYSDENEKIEKQIDVTVKEYMNYESSTLKDLKLDSSENAIYLTSIYPELKSDKLIKNQITIYEQNNATIKKLKEEKINIPVYKWLVYFGK